ncbi:hypothetical protein [Thermococcus argininiproducens]|nr:hypothetical protein [Thermococcus argininiproducens]
MITVTVILRRDMLLEVAIETSKHDLNRHLSFTFTDMAKGSLSGSI